MVTISLSMIVKNEEENIRKCLVSIRDVVDEIVIVDTGSTDRTKEIVSEFTDKIYDFTWIDDFSAARNEAFSHATKDYILWLDADDVLLSKDAKKLGELKKTLSKDIDVVYFVYNYAFDENGNPTLTFQRERLVKRERNFKWKGFVHETIAASGASINSDIIVTHTRVHGDSDRNLNLYRKKKNAGVIFDARDQYYYGKELYYHRILDKAVHELEKVLSMNTWIEDKLDAINCIGDCYIWKEEYEKAREVLFRGLHDVIPRAETVYRIALSFQNEKKYEEAIFWYNMIFQLKKPNTTGFLYDEFWTWKPHLELCVCYDRIGDYERGREENNKAAEIVPNHPSVQNNISYFKKIFG